ncbi:PucR family transcriptional regulator [Streptomyces sp. NPDC001380]|uniref:PucR family transcriptional regulator n=1 Tax=Streptomyces sp. NPDC001380 TaxID=3364566 RepID=UPI00369E21D9
MHCFADDDWDDIRDDLPQEVVPLLRAGLPHLTDLTVREILRCVPEFRRPAPAGGPDAAGGCTVRLGVERALAGFADRAAAVRGAPDPDTAELFRSLGRAEAREGRGPDALRAAYRTGARAVWRWLVESGSRAGVPPERMYRVAEAVFAYAEELTGHSAEGYGEVRTALAGEVQRNRRRLLELLTGTPVPGREAVAALARAARWPLPETVRAVALRPSGRAGEPGPLPPDPLLPAAGVDALADTEGPEPYLLLADLGPRTRPVLDRALGGRPAAVGPPVRLADAGVSLRWARRLLALGARGLGEGPVLHCADHLPALVLLGDETLVRIMAGRRLAPLQKLTVRQRERLAETLLAWLDCGGSAPGVARLLGVHPQTVRYRLRQIEELFGEGLHDPDVRFELELALRARRLLSGLAPSTVPGAGTGTGTGAGGPGDAGTPGGLPTLRRSVAARVAGPAGVSSRAAARPAR